MTENSASVMLAWLVQHLHRHGRLAQIVQQPRHASQLDLLFIEPELTGQCNHHGADSHRMHIGVVVGSLEAGQADEGAGIAGDRVLNLLHQALCT